MKQIEVKPGIVILTPWYTQAEAAAHCGMARSTFVLKAIAGGLPCHGDETNKRYEAEELDRWIANRFRFPESETAAPGSSRKARRAPGAKGRGLRNPQTGEFYRGAES
ncbi:MAG: helix-turn-helix domain-containing protein [Deltaproteobacteria bacterium]|nr:helix-turn-helix domain-containing protein [Deltaproteobacteria bacterium]